MVGWHGITVALLIVLSWVVALAVYLDARSNSPHGAVPWGVAALLGGPLAVVCYLWLGRAPERTGDGSRRAWTTDGAGDAE